MFERFTDSARHVLVVAQEEARLLDHHFIGTEHILLGLIHHESGVASQVLTELGVSLPAARERVVATIGLAAGPRSGSPPFTPRAKKVLELSLREAQQLGPGDIDTGHILLGLVREGEGVGAQVLVGLGIDLAEVRQRVTQALVGMQGTTAPRTPAGGSPAREAGGPRARVVVCSFCGLSPPASGQLVSGDDAFICEHCIHRWSTRLTPSVPLQLRRPGWVSHASVDIPRHREPDDADGARAEIMAAFAASLVPSDDGQSVPAVEMGDDLGPTLASANQRHGDILADGPNVSVSVDEIHFYDTGRAAVWFSIALGGTRLLRRHRGEAVLVDGEWRMARATFCQLMRMAGVSCPPEAG